MGRLRFRLPAIEASLAAFCAAFPAINEKLAMRRELPTADMLSSIVEAYDYVNTLLEKDTPLFDRRELHHLLELNHIVLCGRDPAARQAVWSHLAETRKSFSARIRPIEDFVRRDMNGKKPYRTATGFYTRMLSRPQLFLEGNHRTGNIVLNYLLAVNGGKPYIVDPDSAVGYLDISGRIKFTEKHKGFETAFMMPGHARDFRDFLKEHGTRDWLEET